MQELKERIRREGKVLLAFLAKTMGTRYFWAQMAARAMPLASAVRTMVMSPTERG